MRSFGDKYYQEIAPGVGMIGDDDLRIIKVEQAAQPK